MPKALVLPSGDRHSAAPCARSADLGGSLSLTRNGRGNHRATSNAAPENSGGAQSRSVRLTWSGTWSNAGAVTRRATLAGGLADVRSVLANIRRQMSAQLRWQSEDVTVTETSSSTQLAFIVTLRVRFRPLPVLPGLFATFALMVSAFTHRTQVAISPG